MLYLSLCCVMLCEQLRGQSYAKRLETMLDRLVRIGVNMFPIQYSLFWGSHILGAIPKTDLLQLGPRIEVLQDLTEDSGQTRAIVLRSS